MPQDEAVCRARLFQETDEDEPTSEGVGRNPEADFRGERRGNETHRPTRDPDSRVVKRGKGKEARLCFGARALVDNREGLMVGVRLTPECSFPQRGREFPQSIKIGTKVRAGLLNAQLMVQWRRRRPSCRR